MPGLPLWGLRGCALQHAAPRGSCASPHQPPVGGASLCLSPKCASPRPLPRCRRLTSNGRLSPPAAGASPHSLLTAGTSPRPEPAIRQRLVRLRLASPAAGHQRLASPSAHRQGLASPAVRRWTCGVGPRILMSVPRCAFGFCSSRCGAMPLLDGLYPRLSRRPPPAPDLARHPPPGTSLRPPPAARRLASPAALRGASPLTPTDGGASPLPPLQRLASPGDTRSLIAG